MIMDAAKGWGTPALAALALSCMGPASAAKGQGPQILYVSHSSGRVEILNGQYTKTGSLSKGLAEPNGVWVDAEGNLYVADDKKRRVDEYPPGAAVPSITYRGFNDPVSGTTDAAGNVYVCDFNPAGTSGTIDEFAQGGGKPIQTFAVTPGHPEAVAFDAQGNLFVDWVQVRSSGFEGSFFEFIDANPNRSVGFPILLDFPGGIVIDKKGNVLIVDQAQNALFVVAPPYRALTNEVTGFNQPFDLALDAAGKVLFLTERGSAVVDVLNYPSLHSITTLGAGNGISGPLGVTAFPPAKPDHALGRAFKPGPRM